MATMQVRSRVKQSENNLVFPCLTLSIFAISQIPIIVEVGHNGDVFYKARQAIVGYHALKGVGVRGCFRLGDVIRIPAVALFVFASGTTGTRGIAANFSHDELSPGRA